MTEPQPPPVVVSSTTELAEGESWNTPGPTDECAADFAGWHPDVTTMHRPPILTAPTAGPTAGHGVATGDDPAHAYEQGLGRFLTERWGRAVTVSGLTRVTGGNARATWRCDAGCEGSRRGLILRVSAGPALHLSAFRREYDALQLARRLEAPVPMVLFLEHDARWLGAPFALVEEIGDIQTSVSGFDLPAEVRDRLAHSMWTTLGRMARRSVDGAEVPPGLGHADDDQAATQLTEWSEAYSRSEIHPDPVVHAAIRWLQAHRPRPPRYPVLVHGDYRVGNLLHDQDGNVHAVVDWELAHVGDPLEDLAWTLDARQDANRPELAGGLIAHREAVRLWQEASGLEIDPRDLRWWQVLSGLKAIAIWAMSAHLFEHSADRRPIDGRMGWLLLERQRRILVDLVSPARRGRFYRYEP